MKEDYIGRQPAIKNLEGWRDSLNRKSRSYAAIKAAFNRCIAELTKLPPADVKPVVRGRWVLQNSGKVCSNCGCFVYYEIDDWNMRDGNQVISKFCPFCGGDMETI